MKPDNTEELREKLRALPRTKNTDPRYPIDAYEDDLVELITSHTAKQTKKAYSSGYIKAKREPIEHKTVSLPFSTASKYWNGDMFEDWLKSDAQDEYMDLRKFLRRRDDLIEAQVRQKLIAHLSKETKEKL